MCNQVLSLRTMSLVPLMFIRSFFKYRETPNGLRGEGSTLELTCFNLLAKKNSYTYLLSKLRNSLPSHKRVASDVNDVKGKHSFIVYIIFVAFYLD